MRIISGTAKGNKLKSPKGLNTRPTTDRIKESLFSIINFDLIDAKFLDLYSGSGAIGIEALSRGALSAVFVDEDETAYQCILDNLHHTKLIDKANVYKNKVDNVIKKLSKNNEKFDIIFLDPPYFNNDLKVILKMIYEEELLEPQGYIILESSSKITIDIGNYKVIKEKKYKTTTLTFLAI